MSSWESGSLCFNLSAWIFSHSYKKRRRSIQPSDRFSQQFPRPPGTSLARADFCLQRCFKQTVYVAARPARVSCFWVTGARTRNLFPNSGKGDFWRKCKNQLADVPRSVCPNRHMVILQGLFKICHWSSNCVILRRPKMSNLNWWALPGIEM